MSRITLPYKGLPSCFSRTLLQIHNSLVHSTYCFFFHILNTAWLLKRWFQGHLIEEVNSSAKPFLLEHLRSKSCSAYIYLVYLASRDLGKSHFGGLVGSSVSWNGKPHKHTANSSPFYQTAFQVYFPTASRTSNSVNLHLPSAKLDTYTMASNKAGWQEPAGRCFAARPAQVRHAGAEGSTRPSHSPTPARSSPSISPLPCHVNYLPRARKQPLLH